ncbi:hypothetical protein RB623_26750 [Mesorhizobium sp. LHD-90]|uniref:hypothetical protein n=1 Tax=Mesorhizobium sp. LHD-90 TaxID=3071414 RepID=UPI0027DEE1C0|nr:hypothetical protein [Mesorhizobium sp. LHD-90]MDQ6437666.1 hypothetical protein [Mesorhizobium sp. LHD-90]
MKRLALTAAAILLAVAPASAVSRYDTQRMSCAKVQAALRSDSPAILRFQSQQSGVTLYNLYVGSGQDCRGTTIPRARTVPAADGPCTVLQCVTPPHNSR